MKRQLPFHLLLSLTAAVLGLTGVGLALAQSVPPAPNGIALPEGYRDWRGSDRLHLLVTQKTAAAPVYALETIELSSGGVLGRHDVAPELFGPRPFDLHRLEQDVLIAGRRLARLSVRDSAPRWSAAIVFPPATSLTQADRVTVRGTAADNGTITEAET